MKKKTSTESAPKRPVRAKPAREHPARGSTTMFRPSEVPPPPSDGPTEKAVESAYRVLDDHLARGREAARSRAEKSAPRVSDAVPGDPARRVLRAMVDTWQAWADLVTPYARRVTDEVSARATERRARPPTPDMKFDGEDERWHEVRPSFFPDAPTDERVAPPASISTGDSTMSVAVDVRAARPVAVRVELSRAPGAGALRVLPLHPIGCEAAALQGFVLTAGEGGVALRGEVPDAQPAGTYVGAIVEGVMGRHLGGVTLTLRG